MKFMRDTHLNAKAKMSLSFGKRQYQKRVSLTLISGSPRSVNSPNIAPLSFLILIKESFWTKVPGEAFLLRH